MAADLVVSDDLADEVAGVGEVAHDGHPHAQHQDVGVLLQQALHHGLVQHSKRHEHHRPDLTWLDSRFV